MIQKHLFLQIQTDLVEFNWEWNISVELWCPRELREEQLFLNSSVIRTNPGHKSELSVQQSAEDVVWWYGTTATVPLFAVQLVSTGGARTNNSTTTEKVPRWSFKSKQVTLGGVNWTYLDLTSVCMSSLSWISQISEDVRRFSSEE